MLRSLHSLFGSSVRASDGEIGTAHDFFIYDRTWVIRYLVVETGGWLTRKRVLLAPSALGTPDWIEKVFPVAMTKDQVQNSPDVDTEMPVSRQQEIAISQYFGWPMDWATEPIILTTPYVSDLVQEPEGDPHLRSAKALVNYSVWATDGELGQVSDLILDDSDWSIKYLTVHTGSWFSGQNLMVSTRWVASISWSDKRVQLNHARDGV